MQATHIGRTHTHTHTHTPRLAFLVCWGFFVSSFFLALLGTLWGHVCNGILLLGICTEGIGVGQYYSSSCVHLLFSPLLLLRLVCLPYRRPSSDRPNHQCFLGLLPLFSFGHTLPSLLCPTSLTNQIDREKEEEKRTADSGWTAGFLSKQDTGIHKKGAGPCVKIGSRQGDSIPRLVVVITLVGGVEEKKKMEQGVC